MEKVGLGKLVTIKTGKLDANAENPDGKYPFFTCSKENKYINDYAFDGEYILVAGNGDLNVKYYNGRFNAYQRTYTIKPSGEIWGKYLYYFLEHYIERLRELSIGGVIKYIKLNNLTDAEIPLPPLETQKRIAEILDNAAALSHQTQILLKEYEQLGQSIFLEIFGDPVTNPKGWDVKKLDDLTALITDGKHGNCNNEDNSGYYFISAKDVRNNEINYTATREIPKNEFQEVDKRTNLQPGDLVMVNTGATIGRMAIAKDIPETRRTTFQKSVAVIKTDINVLVPEFLQYVFELRLETFVTKGSGSAIKNLLLSEMRRFQIITPPIDLQKLFATKIESIEQQKKIAKLEFKESQDLFQALLQKAFKGELIKEENYEIA